MTSVKVKFSPSSVILKEGTVYYQIIHHRKVRHVRTGYKLFSSEWISASGGINVLAGSEEGRKNYLVALKKQINKDLVRIKKCINRLNQENSPFTVDRIIELYTAPEGNTTFLLYGKELLAELRQIGKIRTAGTYQSALNSFERYLNNRGDVPLDEMDSNQMIAYESWLKGNGICPNTCSYYMRNLRAIYNRAVNEGLVVQRNPFKHVYTGIDKTKKRAVSLSVIRRIRDLDLNKKSLIFAKDIFMFSFYTRGMSFVDMAFLKKKDLQNGILTYRRKKTGQQLFIKWEKTGQQLFIKWEKPMQELIDKYNTSETSYLLPIIQNNGVDEWREKPMQELIDKYNTSETSYLLPIIQNNGVDEWHQYQNEAHRINRNLKLIGKQIGLGIPLTTYVARHAWASIAQSKNVSLPVISEALGHDSEQTTRIYLASLDTSIVDKANSLILMSI